MATHLWRASGRATSRGPTIKTAGGYCVVGQPLIASIAYRQAPMFEVTCADIALLNDEDLRALVGRLCEAEVRRHRYPVSLVTWGGDQNARDEGIDVRVDMPNDAAIQGFVPRPKTGFQVKREKMPASKIAAEMRPGGSIRPSIRELAEKAGAYIVVSSKDSTTESSLRARRKAMGAAVADLPNPDALTLDFYDCGRIATWVRDHLGLIPWVRERIGRAVHGWRAYGPWAYGSDGDGGEYLLDPKPRVMTGERAAPQGYAAVEGINRIRDLLRRPGGVVRLFGLSGVGKTRLAQALFDSLVGEDALDPSHAFYTDVAADRPVPHPPDLVSHLIATRTAGIVVVDNCPAALHNSLSEACRQRETTVSVITIEYDIQEDEPEGTRPVRLEPSSNELIEELIKRRFPTISPIDLRQLAEFAGGNARIAITLADTIDRTDTIAGLNDQELLRRIVFQRHEPDERFLGAAEACSLVYSFQGEDVTDEPDAELTRLAPIIGQAPSELYRHVAELQRRGLVQRRSVWRAVLPPAISNRLAATALQNIPRASITAHLVQEAPARLLKSFSRRLGYLDTSIEAATIVREWLAPDGLLGQVAGLDNLKRTMLEYVAPVAPDAALEALERALVDPASADTLPRCREYARLLRLLAWDSGLFDRCIKLLATLAQTENNQDRTGEATRVFASLFPLYLSCTHATLDQRLRFIASLLDSREPSRRALGITALSATLDTHFSSHYGFEFGARSRDYGYWPRTNEEVIRWYTAVLRFCQPLACADDSTARAVRAAIAERFRGLWACPGIQDELEQVCVSISDQRFWPEAWTAVQVALEEDANEWTPQIARQTARLEERLRPEDLVQTVRAMVLSSSVGGYGLDDLSGKTNDDLETLAQDLGTRVASDECAFSELVNDIVCSDAQRLFSFGRGLCQGTHAPEAVWQRLREAVRAAQCQLNLQALRGFLNALYQIDAASANRLLDSAVEDETLAPWYPVLQTAVAMDKRAVDRMVRSLALKSAPAHTYGYLSWGRVTDPIPVEDLSRLILSITSTEDGLGPAVDILYMRFHSDDSEKRSHAAELVNVGREIIRRLSFSLRDHKVSRRLGAISASCFAGDGGSVAVTDFCLRLKGAVAVYDADSWRWHDFLEGLFMAQPLAALDALLGSDDGAVGARIIRDARRTKINRGSLLDSVPEGTLLDWCDGEPTTRYPQAAALVTISRQLEGTELLAWTKIADELLQRAPDRVEVLRAFVAQFRPSSWSGSLSAILDAHVKLLDDLERHHDPDVVDFVKREKVRLAEAVEESRRWESVLHARADERFE